MEATERNEFIREHYELFEKMCRSSAAKVLRKYSNVSREDLIGYAMLGVVEAVERADIHNRCWQAYVYRYCYLYAVAGAKEMLGMRLCVIHNLYFYNHLMEDIRNAIEEGNYSSFKKERIELLKTL